MADLSVVMEKLQGFEAADDLAAYFADYGILAQPRNARSCAIAQFVTIETGLAVAVNTSALRIENEEGDVIECIQHTAAMENFVEKYDRGYYPELVEEGFEVHEIDNNEDSGCHCPDCI